MQRLVCLATVCVALFNPSIVQAADPAPDPVVAIVNGDPIKRSEIERAAQLLPEQYQQMPFQMLFEPLLNRVVDSRVLAAEADKRKLGDEPAVQAALVQARRDVLRNELIESAVAAGTTKEKLEQAYALMKAQPGFAAEEVRARHILVQTKEEADAVMKALAAGGDFKALAQEKSIDPSAKDNGGELGYFRREMMVGPFADAAFAQEKGSISKEPVQTQFGWHIIEVEDRRTAVPSFEEKEPELREQVAREIVTALLAESRKDATIQLFNFDGTPKAN